jgi:hypothetical protein
MTTAEAPEDTHLTFEIKDSTFKQKKWKLFLYLNHLTLTSDENTYLIHRTERERVAHMKLLFMKRAYRFKLEKKKEMIFDLPQDVHLAMQAWIGPLTKEDLKIALKEQLRWTLPIGVLYVFSSMPIAGNPSAGLPPVPLDLLGMILGSLLVLTAMMAKVVPHRAYFLIDSLWFLVMAGYNIANVIQGGSLWWLLLVGLQLQLSNKGVHDFRRFAPVKTDENTAAVT